MTHGPKLRMDNLFFSLKELQNEKVCLEQKLHDVKLKHHSLEQELDHVTDKCTHVQEKHRRMSETFAVAQQKVDQTMATSVSLQADVEQSRPKVDELQGNIETEKNLQLQFIKDFEVTLLSISSQLFSSRDFYKSSNLNTEINNTQKACLDLEQRERKTRNMHNLTRCLEKLTQDEKSLSLSKLNIEDSLCACFRVMDQDEKEAKAYLKHIQSELKEIHDILRGVE